MVTVFGNIVSVETRTSVNNVEFLVGTVTNMLGQNNQTSNIQQCTPYGMSSYPVDFGKCVVQPINGSNKDYVISGFVQGLPTDITHEVVSGESWLYSTKYVLIAQNDGLMAYRNDNLLHATLPIGESVVATMLNRINEMQAQITYLTTLVSQLQSHSHPGNGTPPSQTFTTPSTPATLAKDKAYLTAGKALIDDNGEVYA